MKSDNSVDIFFLGDTYFGEWHMRLRGRKGQSDILKEKGYLHFGKNFESLLNDGDEVIVNLECSITDIEPSPLANTTKFHIYSGREEGTIKALKQLNTTTVMLGNNHAVDYGKAGLIDTIDTLNRADIKYIGAGKYDLDAQKPLIFEKECNGKVFKAVVVSCYNDMPDGRKYEFYAKSNVPGVNKLRVDEIKKQVKSIKKEDENTFYILSPHWGPNYAFRTYKQQQLSKELIKAGVDLIVGHSAHMIQEVETYNKKLTLFSIGNFLFNANGEYKSRKLPPYSFISRLNIQNINGKLVKKMLLYPFVGDNIGTDFTPRYVNNKEFEHVVSIMKSHSFDMERKARMFKTGKDEFSYYLEYKVI